jgi:hypothetical protein
MARDRGLPGEPSSTAARARPHENAARHFRQLENVAEAERHEERFLEI